LVILGYDTITYAVDCCQNICFTGIMKNKIKEKNKLDDMLKIILVGAVVLIAVALTIYVLRPTKVKTTFEVCYEQCKKLGIPPENGECPEGTRPRTLKSDSREWKKGDLWCLRNAGECFDLCLGK